MKDLNQKCDICGFEWKLIQPPTTLKNPSDIYKMQISKETLSCKRCEDKKALEQLNQNNHLNKSNSKTDASSFNLSEPKYTLINVVLNAKALNSLQEGLLKIKYHKTIYEEWGFGKIDKCGNGIIWNFYGKPGTGKTRTAEAIAGELNKKIIALGLSDVESKYMGETAKNITAAFAAAKENDAILFFDEADTLLGKRIANVTQGVDNEVNTLRSTMLIELERFTGIIIFATNFAEGFDSAFVSRFSHSIEFDLPNFEARLKLWEMHLVPGIPYYEERSLLIEKCAEHSEGFAGRDIRKAVRLALPKILKEQEPTSNLFGLKWLHLIESINQVREESEKVGSKRIVATEDQKVAASLLGIKTQKKDQ